jgi:putative ATPase
LQLLDSLRQPRVLQGNSPALTEQLDNGERFEWIGGRHPFQTSDPALLPKEVAAITTLAAAGAELRLLLTAPQLGPAAALAKAGTVPSELDPLVQQLIPLERDWLAAAPPPQHLQHLLEQQGWQVQWQRWQEPLELELSPALLQRWFADTAPYRQRLAAVLPAAGVGAFCQWAEQLQGQRLPQLLEHQLLLGSHKKAPA